MKVNYMFKGCSSLKNLDISKVNNLDSTFTECSSLESLEGISQWNISNIKTIYETFYGCGSLTSIIL